MERTIVRIVVVIIILSLVIPGITSMDTVPQETFALADDLEGAKVAVLYRSNNEISNACRIAMESMYRWMNATVDTVTPNDIKDGILFNYDILGVPPGTLDEYTVSLGTSGLRAIRDFVKYGGSYVGISRGAQFACDNVIYGGVTTERLLMLFNGTARGAVDNIYEQYMHTVNINTTCPGPDLSGLPSTLVMMGWETIWFEPENMPPLNIIATYPSNDEPAMISYQVGSGCVFLTGVHPELEEDSDRDNSDYFDHHEDPQTDWPLMVEVSQWLVETSTWDNASIDALTETPTTTTDTTTETTAPTDTTTDTPTETTTETDTTSSTTSDDDPSVMPLDGIMVVGSIGVVIAVAVVIVILKKR
jgi:glutamine amidotransferase-like uncharacterized protein